jgi:hypothetical protein
MWHACDSYLALFHQMGWFPSLASSIGGTIFKVVLTQLIGAIAESLPFEPDNLTVLIVTLLIGYVAW